MRVSSHDVCSPIEDEHGFYAECSCGEILEGTSYDEVEEMVDKHSQIEEPEPTKNPGHTHGVPYYASAANTTNVTFYPVTTNSTAP